MANNNTSPHSKSKTVLKRLKYEQKYRADYVSEVAKSSTGDMYVLRPFLRLPWRRAQDRTAWSGLVRTAIPQFGVRSWWWCFARFAIVVSVCPSTGCVDIHYRWRNKLIIHKFGFSNHSKLCCQSKVVFLRTMDLGSILPWASRMLGGSWCTWPTVGRMLYCVGASWVRGALEGINWNWVR